MEEKRLRLRTYRQVWRLEQVIYQIERVRLPFPVTFRQIGLFAGVLLLMVLLSPIPPLAQLSPLLRYGLIPGLAAWYLTSQKLDGKLPHRWALSMLRYWFSPRRYSRLRPLTPGEKKRLAAPVSYRVAKGAPAPDHFAEREG